MQNKKFFSFSYSMFLKRFIDIVASSVLLVLLSPVFAIIALLIKKEGGTVLFHNKRIGKGGKVFYCLKFRSMIPNAEQALNQVLENDPEAKAHWETHRKLKNDPRITKIGKFLRKSSLDELPQLINILKGEMSLVGPRPILEDEQEFFNHKQLAMYFSVRPGLTGLWQISGRNNTSFKQRVEFDTIYVEKLSMIDDLVILFKTFLVIINRNGAY